MGKRLHTLKLVKALRESKRSWEEIGELLGISRATYYRWEKAWKEKGLAGLQPKSRRPRRVRGKVQWKPELLVRVEELRKENPTWGRWPIWLALRREGFPVGERTVGRILAYLEGRGRVERVASYLARRGGGKARGRPRRPYAFLQRHQASLAHSVLTDGEGFLLLPGNPPGDGTFLGKRHPSCPPLPPDLDPAVVSGLEERTLWWELLVLHRDWLRRNSGKPKGDRV